MVILHLINSLERGGAEVLLKNTVSCLSSHTNIVCYLKKACKETVDVKADAIVFLNHTSKFDTLFTIYKLRNLIKQRGVNVIHAHLFDSVILARLATTKNVKLVFTLHNILSRDAFFKNRFSLFVEKLTYNSAQYLIAVSNAVLSDYKKYINVTGQSKVIYNFVPDLFFKTEFKIKPENSFKLIAVGNLRVQKNYQTLFEAFLYLKHLPITLDVFGSGDLRQELNTFISENSLPIRLKGSVEGVHEYLSDYHILISSSIYEGFGLAPVEAMAAGIPVILSDIPVYHEIALPNTIFIDPLDAKNIAKKIELAYTSYVYDEEIATQIKKHASVLASRESYLAALNSVYATF